MNPPPAPIVLRPVDLTVPFVPGPALRDMDKADRTQAKEQALDDVRVVLFR
jgi:hypothetical protein